MRLLTVGMVLSCATLWAGVATAGNALSGADMPDELRAILAKEKAKAQVASRTKAEEAGDAAAGGKKSGGCDVNIGNVSGSKPGAAPRSVTTIVMGPVIQMDNKCK